MTTVLVTGAGGYIGTTLVPMLLAEGYAVKAVDRFFFGMELLTRHENLTLVREDTRKLAAGHFTGVDYVIDLAAVSNDPSGELFQEATWQINHLGRERCADLAKKAGVKRYILPSSCSIYGWQAQGEIADENSAINPLTTYARANARAEEGALALADDSFTVVALRQATVFGLSPRMRFDLAINGMTFGAVTHGVLPLMRDGFQWRPMVHVRDTAAAQMFMLTAPADKVNGQTFNVGSDACTYQLKALAKEVADNVPRDVRIEWYGDVDHRSYRVAFDRIEGLGWKARIGVAQGVQEIAHALQSGAASRDVRSITLDWYRELETVHARFGQDGAEESSASARFVRDIAMYGGILNI